MVAGNFAMLADVDPKTVPIWYLAVYADAYEWVELPNTLGMSQFADGGLLGSKPYAASGKRQAASGKRQAATTSTRCPTTARPAAST